MAAFEQTTRALASEAREGTWRWLAALCLLLLAAGGWAVLARVELVVVSRAARFEPVGEVRRLQPAVDGRVKASQLVLGRAVRAGELLLELDAEELDCREATARARAAQLDGQLASVDRERQLAEEAIGLAARSGDAARREAGARRAAADEETARAADFAERTARLADVVSPLEAETARSQAAERRAVGRARRAEQARAASAGRTAELEQERAVLRLHGEAERLRGERALVETELAAVARERERHQVRAPVDGVLGDVVILDVGSHVLAGAVVATVVPAGPLRVVAELDASDALGRVVPGQQASLRVHAFPWTLHGAVPATVVQVARESHDGRVRVELAPAVSSLPLASGMPCEVHVRLAEVSPLALLLRRLDEALR